MNSWKLFTHDGRRLLCRYAFLLEHVALDVYISNWLIMTYFFSLRISKWSGLLKPWNDIAISFACLMMIYRWISDIFVNVENVQSFKWWSRVLEVTTEISISHYFHCPIGYSWCCTCWTTGNCEIPRSTVVWFYETKDSYSWSWEVLSKLIVM